MTRDYAKQPKRTTPARNTRRQPSRKTLPNWLWMVAGVLVGALVMAIVGHNSPPEREEIAEVIPEPEVAPDPAAPRPRFDFYTLLKESEVILNDDGTAATAVAAVPGPALPPPSQPRPSDADVDAAPEIASPATSEVIALAQPIVTPPVETAPAPAAPPPPQPAAAPAQPAAPSSAPAAPSREVFLLQAGSFKSAADADNLRARLLLLNMRARVETVNLRPGETWHRVQVGPFDNTQSLAGARNLLQQNGIASIQVKKTQ